MSLYEPLFRRVLYPAYESGLRRRDTLRYLRDYERDQWRSPDEIDALQWQSGAQLPAIRVEGLEWAEPRWQWRPHHGAWVGRLADAIGENLIDLSKLHPLGCVVVESSRK